MPSYGIFERPCKNCCKDTHPQELYKCKDYCAECFSKFKKSLQEEAVVTKGRMSSADPDYGYFIPSHPYDSE